MLKTVSPDARLTGLRETLIRTIQEEFADIRPEHAVAVLSHTVGQIIAMCDQTKVTPSMMMKVVQVNLEAGNKLAIQTMIGETKGTA